jgi:hypothetical protein
MEGKCNVVDSSLSSIPEPLQCINEIQSLIVFFQDLYWQD